MSTCLASHQVQSSSQLSSATQASCRHGRIADRTLRRHNRAAHSARHRGDAGTYIAALPRRHCPFLATSVPVRARVPLKPFAFQKQPDQFTYITSLSRHKTPSALLSCVSPYRPWCLTRHLNTIYAINLLVFHRKRIVKNTVDTSVLPDYIRGSS